MAVWDEEMMVLAMVIGDLQKLDADAQVRILRYVTARLGLPLLLLKSKTIQVPDVERCEEIEETFLSA